MEIVAGIDIGNATTEVALAKIQNNKIFSGIFFFLFRFIMIPPSRQAYTTSDMPRQSNRSFFIFSYCFLYLEYLYTGRISRRL